MSEGPVISIIIVSYNTRDVLRDCLASIVREADVPYEVIVVDNASPDASVEMVEQEFPTFRAIRSGGNIGFSPANNIGLTEATGSYLLLLNPDTLLLPQALSSWLRDHEAQHAGISGPFLQNADGSHQRSAWKEPGLLSSLAELVFLHKVLQFGSYPERSFRTDFQPDFVSGAALLFHRSIYERIGGLDPQMFWCEDVDLCVRVRKSGGTCYFLHRPRIIHLGGQSSKKNVDRVISNQLISRIKFSRKHRNVLITLLLVMVIALHAFSRALVFGFVGLIRTEPRARAYRYTLRKLGRYLFLADRSI